MKKILSDDSISLIAINLMATIVINPKNHFNCPCGKKTNEVDVRFPGDPICFNACSFSPKCNGCEGPLAYLDRNLGHHFPGTCIIRPRKTMFEIFKDQNISCSCGKQLEFWDYLREDTKCATCQKS